MKPKCANCPEKRPAVCVGVYEDSDKAMEFACDVCCGHGNEDGFCVMLARAELPLQGEAGVLQAVDDLYAGRGSHRALLRALLAAYAAYRTSKPTPTAAPACAKCGDSGWITAEYVDHTMRERCLACRAPTPTGEAPPDLLEEVGRLWTAVREARHDSEESDDLTVALNELDTFLSRPTPTIQAPPLAIPTREECLACAKVLRHPGEGYVCGWHDKGPPQPAKAPAALPQGEAAPASPTARVVAFADRLLDTESPPGESRREVFDPLPVGMTIGTDGKLAPYPATRIPAEQKCGTCGAVGYWHERGCPKRPKPPAPEGEPI